MICLLFPLIFLFKKMLPYRLLVGKVVKLLDFALTFKYLKADMIKKSISHRTMLRPYVSDKMKVTFLLK